VNAALEESDIMKTIKVCWGDSTIMAGADDQTRTELLKALLVEQVIGGFKQAVSINEDKDGGASLVIQKEVKLQRPRSESITLICP
jgi:hypothetical protein